MNKFMLMIFFLFLLVLGYAYVCNDDTRVMKEKIGILKQNKISLPLERMKYKMQCLNFAGRKKTGYLLNYGQN